MVSECQHIWGKVRVLERIKTLKFYSKNVDGQYNGISSLILLEFIVNTLLEKRLQCTKNHQIYM